MTRTPPLLALLAPLALGACVIPVPVPNDTPGAVEVIPADTCGARGLGRFVGGPAGAVEGVRLVGADGQPAVVRVIRPGDAVTMDFREDRVNVEVDAAGAVSRIYCG